MKGKGWKINLLDEAELKMAGEPGMPAVPMPAAEM